LLLAIWVGCAGRKRDNGSRPGKGNRFAPG
jgi:hypothetical protein